MIYIVGVEHAVLVTYGGVVGFGCGGFVVYIIYVEHAVLVTWGGWWWGEYIDNRTYR